MAFLTISIGKYRIVRPKTAHAIYTHTNSICYGSHYIASSTMMDTLSGFVHNFTANIYNRNTSRNRSFKPIFRRMIIFYHMALVRNLIEQDGNYELTPNIFFIDTH